MSHASKICSGVGLLYQNSVLLAKRVSHWEGVKVNYGGYWSIFGGVVESGESREEAAARELWEESQIKVDKEDLVFIKTIEEDIPEDTINSGFKKVEFSFYFTELKELINPVLNEEHTEFGWFSIDSLSNFHDKIDPKIIECVYLYKKWDQNEQHNIS